MNKALTNQFDKLIFDLYGKTSIHSIEEVMLSSTKDMSTQNNYVMFFGYFDLEVNTAFKGLIKTVSTNTTMPSMFEYVLPDQDEATFIGLKIQFNQPIKGYTEVAPK